MTLVVIDTWFLTMETSSSQKIFMSSQKSFSQAAVPPRVKLFSCFFVQKKMQLLGENKVLYGWTDLPSRVSLSGVFFSFFFSKNDPKNTKILKKKKKSSIFCREVLGKYFDLFSKISSQNF